MFTKIRLGHRLNMNDTELRMSAGVFPTLLDYSRCGRLYIVVDAPCFVPRFGALVDGRRFRFGGPAEPDMGIG
jgi:hypothetical protein